MREYGEVGTTRNPAYSTSYDTLQDGAEKQTGNYTSLYILQCLTFRIRHYFNFYK